MVPKEEPTMERGAEQLGDHQISEIEALVNPQLRETYYAERFEAIKTGEVVTVRRDFEDNEGETYNVFFRGDCIGIVDYTPGGYEALKLDRDKTLSRPIFCNSFEQACDLILSTPADE
jgi:hypothetical protein